MFELDLQSDDEHSARGVEGIFSCGRVDATIHLVEKILDADTGFYECPLRAIKGVGGVEVPYAIARGILISACIIGLGLEAAIQIDV